MLLSLKTKDVDLKKVNFQTTYFEEDVTMSVSKQKTFGDYVVSAKSPIFFFNFVSVSHVSLNKYEAEKHIIEFAKEPLLKFFKMGYKLNKVETTITETDSETIISGLLQVECLFFSQNPILYPIEQHQFIKVDETQNEFLITAYQHPSTLENFLVSCEIDQALLTDFIIHRTLKNFLNVTNDVVEVCDNDLYIRKNKLMDCVEVAPNMVMLDVTISQMRLNYAQKNINVYKV